MYLVWLPLMMLSDAQSYGRWWQRGFVLEILPLLSQLEHLGFKIDWKLLNLLSFRRLPSSRNSQEKKRLSSETLSQWTGQCEGLCVASLRQAKQGQSRQGPWTVDKVVSSVFWLSGLASPTSEATPSSWQLPEGLQIALKASSTYYCKQEVSGQWHPHREMSFEHMLMQTKKTPFP